MSFAHLHVHTEYSLLDGACRISELPKLVKSMGQTACAIMPSVPSKTERCLSFAARKQSLIRPEVPSASIPNRYFELSHRKFAAIPEDRVTICGTFIVLGIKTFFFPISFSCFKQIICLIRPSAYKLIS